MIHAAHAKSLIRILNLYGIREKEFAFYQKIFTMLSFRIRSRYYTRMLRNSHGCIKCILKMRKFRTIYTYMDLPPEKQLQSANVLTYNISSLSPDTITELFQSYKSNR